MSDWIEEIKKIADLKEMGVLSEEEFQQAKLRILSSRDTPDNNSGQTNPEGWQTIAASQNTIPGIQEWNDGVPNVSDPSQRIGSYNILGELGQGGMGVVYRARHIEEGWAQRQGGDVAIKLMHARFARDPGFRERFIREASVGRNVDHPNANKVYEVVIDGDMIGIVMDLIEGHSLQGSIPPNGMNLEAALRILQPVSSALDHLHSKGIIHRDLKPENIRIRTDGEPIILDFGIAKQENDKSGMTQTGVLMGTVSYMAPEQIDAKNVTPAADRYALGIIAYEIFSGGKPWSSDLADGRIFAMKLAGNLIHLSKRSSEIPKYISEAVMRMLSLDPKVRFESCGDFIAALENSGGIKKISMADKLSELSLEEREVEIIKARKQYTQLMGQISQFDLSINSQKQFISSAMRDRDERLRLAEQTFSHEKQRLASNQNIHTEAQGDRIPQITAQFESKRLALIERRNRLAKAVDVAKKRVKKTKKAIKETSSSFFSFMSKSKLTQLEEQLAEEEAKLNQADTRYQEAELGLNDAIETIEAEMRSQIQSIQRDSSHEIEQLRLQSSRGLSEARSAYLELKESIRAEFSTKNHAAEAIIAGLEIEKKELSKDIDLLKNEYPPEVWVMTTIHSIGQEELEMAQIQGGTFWMGAHRDDPASLKDEHPRHEVEITRTFWLATKPINQALYQSLTRKNPSSTKHPRCPVEKVKWVEAIEFCNLLSEHLGLDKAYIWNKKDNCYIWNEDSEGFRLPTEAEWEFSARAGDESLYAGSEQPGNVAWYADNCGSGVQESGLKRSNKFALYDMSGNVWEWCWDYYGDYTAAFVQDPKGPDSGKRRVRRGGSNRNRLQHIRVSNRAASSEDTSQAGIGFRVARTLR